MIVCHFVLFLSAILLLVLRITDSRYLFGVFQLFYVKTSFRIVNYTWWQIFVECLISWYNATTECTKIDMQWIIMNWQCLKLPLPFLSIMRVRSLGILVMCCYLVSSPMCLVYLVYGCFYPMTFVFVYCFVFI